MEDTKKLDEKIEYLKKELEGKTLKTPKDTFTYTPSPKSCDECHLEIMEDK